MLKKKRSRMAEMADDATSTFKPKADLAMEKLGTATEQAKTTMTDTVVPAVQTTMTDTVKPALQEAKDKIVPAIQDAKDKIVPVAEQAFAETKQKTRQAAEKAGVIEEQKKSHKLRNFVILLGLGGAVAYAYTKLTGKQADPAWTPSTSDNVGSARHVAAPVDESDTAPTAPLASEETVESSEPTTPDEPLEKKDVS